MHMCLCMCVCVCVWMGMYMYVCMYICILSFLTVYIHPTHSHSTPSPFYHIHNPHTTTTTHHPLPYTHTHPPPPPPPTTTTTTNSWAPASEAGPGGEKVWRLVTGSCDKEVKVWVGGPAKRAEAEWTGVAMEVCVVFLCTHCMCPCVSCLYTLYVFGCVVCDKEVKVWVGGPAKCAEVEWAGVAMEICGWVLCLYTLYV